MHIAGAHFHVMPRHHHGHYFHCPLALQLEWSHVFYCCFHLKIKHPKLLSHLWIYSTFIGTWHPVLTAWIRLHRGSVDCVELLIVWWWGNLNRRWSPWGDVPFVKTAAADQDDKNKSSKSANLVPWTGSGAISNIHSARHYYLHNDNAIFITGPVKAQISSAEVDVRYAKGDTIAGNVVCTIVSSEGDAMNFYSIRLMRRGIFRKRLVAHGGGGWFGEITSSSRIINLLIVSQGNKWGTLTTGFVSILCSTETKKPVVLKYRYRKFTAWSHVEGYDVDEALGKDVAVRNLVWKESVVAAADCEWAYRGINEEAVGLTIGLAII